MESFPYLVARVPDYEQHELEQAQRLRKATATVEIRCGCATISDAQIACGAFQAKDSEHFYGVIDTSS